MPTIFIFAPPDILGSGHRKSRAGVFLEQRAASLPKMGARKIYGSEARFALSTRWGNWTRIDHFEHLLVVPESMGLEGNTCSLFVLDIFDQNMKK